MFTTRDYLVEKERRHVERQQADLHRLYLQVDKQKGALKTLGQSLTVELGRRLAKLGEEMQSKSMTGRTSTTGAN